MTPKIRLALVLSLASVYCHGCHEASTSIFLDAGKNSYPIDETAGSLTVIKAYLSGVEPQTIEPCIYWLVILPEQQSDGGGSELVSRGVISKHSSIFELDGKETSVVLSWNRKSDLITVGAEEFSRRAGNVLVTIRGTDSISKTTQLESLQLVTNPIEILDYIKASLPKGVIPDSVSFVDGVLESPFF